MSNLINIRYKDLNCNYWENDLWIKAIELYTYLETELENSPDVPKELKVKTLESLYKVHYNIAKSYCSDILEDNFKYCVLAQEALERNDKQILTLLNFNKISKKLCKKYEAQVGRLQTKLLSLNLKYLLEGQLENKQIIKNC